MSTATASFTKVDFQDANSARPARDYSPMRATNPFTGKLQEVVLIEPRRLERAVVVESHPELRADLNAAFSQFTKIQKRVLFRVLVQGQSIETATRGLKKTSMFWWKWMNKEALPKLRKHLADYLENGKLVIG